MFSKEKDAKFREEIKKTLFEHKTKQIYHNLNNLQGINKIFHVPDNFREQIAIFLLDHIDDDQVVLMRHFINTCDPGLAYFDDNQLNSWILIDSLLEGEFEKPVVGIFHTHPAGFNDFSGHDVVAQNGLARAYGSRPILHAVQACGSDKIKIVCKCMIDNKIISDEGFAESSINDMVVIVKFQNAMIIS